MIIRFGQMKKKSLLLQKLDLAEYKDYCNCVLAAKLDDISMEKTVSTI